MASAASPAATTTSASAAPGKRKGTSCSHRALPSFLLLALALALMAVPSAAAVYRVGGSAGWTTNKSVNYTAWAASKTFRVGDTIVFEYNRRLHNVVEVSKAAYRSCNTKSPLATHSTGNDSVTLKRSGHHFFLCSVPGHCALGLKLEVRVPKPKRSAASPPPAVAPASPASSSSPSSAVPHTSAPGAGGSAGASVGGGAAAPRKNGAAQVGTCCYLTAWAVVVLATAIAATSGNLIAC